MRPCQGREGGPIPLTRSKLEKGLVGESVGTGVEEKDSGRIFEQEALKIKIDIFPKFGIERATAILEEFVDFEIVIVGKVGRLSTMPGSVLVGI